MDQTQMVLILFLFLIGNIQIERVLSSCNICSAYTQIACINQTAFQRCKETTALPGTTVNCPSGSYCNSDYPLRCIQGDPSCGGLCGVCNRDTYVACLSRTQYAYCFGSIPSNQIGSCATGEVCNSDDPVICFNPFINLVEPTCPSYDEPSTTTVSPTKTTQSTIRTTITSNPISAAQRFCLSVKYPGRYPKPDDIYCKSYFYCYYMGNNINGQEYNCLGSTLFDCVTQRCSYTCRKNCSYNRINQENENATITLNKILPN